MTRRTRPVVHDREGSGEHAIAGRRKIDPRHSRHIRVHSPEGDEDRQEGDDCAAVRSEDIGHHHGEGSGAAPDRVGACPDRDDRDREVEATDQENADDHASVKVLLGILELLGDVRRVLVSQIRPHDEGRRGADRCHTARQKRREVRGRDPRHGCDDGDRQGREDCGHRGELDSAREADPQVIHDERRDEDPGGHQEHVCSAQGKNELQVRSRRNRRGRGSEDRPGQEKPRGGSAGADPEAFPREDVDPSGLRSPSRELREGVGERIARDRQDDPRKDGRRAGDSSRESGDDEDARSEEGTDVESDGVPQGDDAMKPGPGAVLFLEIWGGRLFHGPFPP